MTIIARTVSKFCANFRAALHQIFIRDLISLVISGTIEPWPECQPKGACQGPREPSKASFRVRPPISAGVRTQCSGPEDLSYMYIYIYTLQYVCICYMYIYIYICMCKLYPRLYVFLKHVYIIIPLTSIGRCRVTWYKTRQTNS